LRAFRRSHGLFEREIDGELEGGRSTAALNAA
jgi:hypothetical protein